MVDISPESQMNEDVAALMLTNPNTLGVFEQQIHKKSPTFYTPKAACYIWTAQTWNALSAR